MPPGGSGTIDKDAMASFTKRVKNLASFEQITFSLFVLTSNRKKNL